MLRVMEETDPSEPGLPSCPASATCVIGTMVRGVSIGSPLEELKLQWIRQP